MDHVVYLDHKARELENLTSGKKSMLIRGAMGRKMPHGRVDVGDQLFFIRNNGEGLIQAKAQVKEVLHSEKMDSDTSTSLLQQHLKDLCLDKRMEKRFAGKRYLVLITVHNFESLEPFTIDRSAYGNMDDWLPVEDIASVRVMDLPL